MQLVLLCLLVSFVVSIATGIITVALLQEAPTRVTQPITRVIRKTVDQNTAASGAASAPQDVVVSED